MDPPCSRHDRRKRHVGDDSSPLRILAVAFARSDFLGRGVISLDLMLAGHTHGGQIQVPLLGAILAPSIYGTKYASGTFYEPPTLMHVSRGVSDGRSRYRCPPEVALP